MEPGRNERPKGRELIAKNAVPTEFPEPQLVAPKQVVFKSEDGLDIHGQLFVPKNQTARGPALIFMYGRAFREPPKSVWRGASEYKDVVAGAKFLQTLENVDPQRIGLWGGSYGGFLSAMGVARRCDIFKAGVGFHGVHDWA